MVAQKAVKEIIDAANERLKAGDHKGALAQFQKNAKIVRNDPIAQNLTAALHISLGEEKLAIKALDRALKLKPDFAEAFCNKAVAYRQFGAHADAVLATDQALALRPEYPDAWYNRGISLSSLGRWPEAAGAFAEVTRLRPRHADAFLRRALACYESGRQADAVACYDAILELKPQDTGALVNRGISLIELKRHAEALASFEQALAIKPGIPKAEFGSANALLALGRDHDALAAYDRAVALEPDSIMYQFNRSMARLALEDWDGGFKDYDRRREIPELKIKPGPPRTPFWNGEDLAGKRLVLFEEQGFGDVINFCRFARHPKLRETEVHVLIRPKLRRLMSSLLSTGGKPDNVHIRTSVTGADKFDAKVSMASACGLLGVQPDALPDDVPYLAAEPGLAALWRARIGQHGFKVGICWQGQPAGAVDWGRSIPLALFAPLAAVEGVRLISLQKRYGLEQLDDLPEGMTVETLGDDFDEGPDAFIDTAAVLASLDLVICSDTSVPHLAGAMGKPVWVALKKACDWRWLRDREDSVWYPSMRLFRQEEPGDWESVMARLAAALTRAAAAGDARMSSVTPFAPVSLGELVDKITILEIKSEELHDPNQLANVAEELTQLNATLSRLGVDPATIATETDGLRQVNRELWKIEDDIRDKERAGEFDQTFTDLARAVYKTNDRRAELKRQINMAANSGLVEEKSYKPY